jgi:CBS domain-containing protein
MSLARFKCPLATIGPEQTVEAAAREMKRRQVGSLLLLDGPRPVGIVTDRDLVVRAVAEGRDPREQWVRDCVTYDPIVVRVEDGIETAVSLMRKHGVRRLPLVDESGAAVGIVTADDLLSLLGREVSAVCEGIDNGSDSEDSR